ncbi:MAG TPA: hypothetical protein VIJ75_10360 [Hanamia sp.]
MALALCNDTHASNAVGMADLVTPTSVGGKAWIMMQLQIQSEQSRNAARG